MSARTFKTEAVLGAYTGICPPCGFSSIHDVLDHLFPGIMTIGCAAVTGSGVGPREIAKRQPSISEYIEKNGGPTTDNWESWFQAAINGLGEDMELSGPSANQSELATEAFDSWKDRAAR